MDIERIFTSDVLRVGFFRDSVNPNNSFIIVANKFRSEKRDGAWVINHLSVEEAGILKDSLVALLEEGEKDA